MAFWLSDVIPFLVLHEAKDKRALLTPNLVSKLNTTSIKVTPNAQTSWLQQDLVALNGQKHVKKFATLRPFVLWRLKSRLFLIPKVAGFRYVDVSTKHDL